MSRWRWARLALADGARRPCADRMASWGMPPGHKKHKKQLSEAVRRRAGRGPAVIIGWTEQIHTALDDAGTAAVRLSRGDMVAGR